MKKVIYTLILLSVPAIVNAQTKTISKQDKLGGYKTTGYYEEKASGTIDVYEKDDFGGKKKTAAGCKT